MQYIFGVKHVFLCHCFMFVCFTFPSDSEINRRHVLVCNVASVFRMDRGFKQELVNIRNVKDDYHLFINYTVCINRFTSLFAFILR